jgi:hypothetical protein
MRISNLLYDINNIPTYELVCLHLYNTENKNQLTKYYCEILSKNKVIIRVEGNDGVYDIPKKKIASYSCMKAD